MYKDEKRHRLKKLFFIGIIIVFIITSLSYRFSHNKSYKNEAVERGESIYLNGQEYCYWTSDEKYTISNIMISKTSNGRKLYEIEEYPNYEYIAVYVAWDGSIYKKVDN